MDSKYFTEEFKKHFGEAQGGANLKQSLENLPLNDLQNLFDRISAMPEDGRIFFLGNGGSFDNARLMAAIARESGFSAKVPGLEEDYESIINSLGYTEVFCESLKRDKLSSRDMVIGISGSGNSPNVLKALSYALAIGADTFAIGGRDGGVMRTVVEKGQCLLAASECMEVIEDTNNLMILSVFKSLKEEQSLTSSVLAILKQFQEFLNGDNYEKLSSIVVGITEAYKNKGRVFILGANIGANHFRADLRRGATDQVPIPGIEVPEIFTTNSYMATANDEGHDFTLAAGLNNFRPDSSDFALLFEDEERQSHQDLCLEILQKNQVPYISVSESSLNINMFDKDCKNFVITMIGHACSLILNKYFKAPFKIRELVQNPGFAENQKKLGMQATISLEERYKAAGLITANEFLTFSYGKVYAVSSSEPFERSFF